MKATAELAVHNNNRPFYISNLGKNIDQKSIRSTASPLAQSVCALPLLELIGGIDSKLLNEL